MNASFERLLPILQRGGALLVAEDVLDALAGYPLQLFARFGVEVKVSEMVPPGTMVAADLRPFRFPPEDR